MPVLYAPLLVHLAGLGFPGLDISLPHGRVSNVVTSAARHNSSAPPLPLFPGLPPYRPDRGESVLRPPPNAPPAPLQLPPPPKNACRGWPSVCAASSSGRCLDPETMICYPPLPSNAGLQCWQGGSVLCGRDPKPPSPFPKFGPKPPPLPKPSGTESLPPPPPSADPGSFIWKQRGAFKYGRPRVSPLSTDPNRAAAGGQYTQLSYGNGDAAVAWYAAEAQCVAFGGHLVSMGSRDEAEFVSNSVLSNFWCDPPTYGSPYGGRAQCPTTNGGQSCPAGCGVPFFTLCNLGLSPFVQTQANRSVS